MSSNNCTNGLQRRDKGHTNRKGPDLKVKFAFPLKLKALLSLSVCLSVLKLSLPLAHLSNLLGRGKRDWLSLSIGTGEGWGVRYID